MANVQRSAALDGGATGATAAGVTLTGVGSGDFFDSLSISTVSFG
jgi:hypothetical protein